MTDLVSRHGTFVNERPIRSSCIVASYRLLMIIYYALPPCRAPAIAGGLAGSEARLRSFNRLLLLDVLLEHRQPQRRRLAARVRLRAVSAWMALVATVTAAGVREYRRAMSLERSDKKRRVP